MTTSCAIEDSLNHPKGFIGATLNVTLRQPFIIQIEGFSDTTPQMPHFQRQPQVVFLAQINFCSFASITVIT